MESDPSNEVDEPAEKQPTSAQRAWDAFNAQGGLVKIIIGSVTAALTAALTALLIALPGVISSWVSDSDEATAVDNNDQTESPSNESAIPPTVAVTIPASTTPPTVAVSSEPSAVALDIEDVRMRLDEASYYLDILLAPPSEEITVNHLAIAATYAGLPCTGGLPYRVELGDTAVAQTTDGDVTTFVFSQSEPGVEGETLVRGDVALEGEVGDEEGCTSPYRRFLLRPQLVTDAGQRAQLEVRIPRTISYVSPDDGVTSIEFDPFYGYGGPSGEILSVAVGTTAGQCAWYPADLSQLDLPRIEPPSAEALSFQNCPEP